MKSTQLQDAETPQDAIAVRVLLVSRNIKSIECLCQHMQTLSIHVDTCCDVDSATRKLCRSKFEGIVVDLELGDEAVGLLKKVRELTSHRHVISFAIVEKADETNTAFHAHANFVIPRPVASPLVLRTLRAAYPMMFQEKRRGYRYAVELRTLVRPDTAPNFYSTSLNISETGICIKAGGSIQVGNYLSLRVDLPGLPEPIRVGGEVVWVDPGGKVGIRFVDVNALNGERLKLWLSERMAELSQH